MLCSSKLIFCWITTICQAHLLANFLNIPLIYDLFLWNRFLKKKKKLLKCELLLKNCKSKAFLFYCHYILAGNNLFFYWRCTCLIFWVYYILWCASLNMIKLFFIKYYKTFLVTVVASLGRQYAMPGYFFKGFHCN